MHRGEDTEFYLKKGYRVVGFEADPELAEYCRNKFSAAIENGLLRIVEGAIAPREVGDEIVFFASANSAWGTVVEDRAKRFQGMGAACRELVVRRVDFSGQLSVFGIPCFIKIDIQGMNNHVLDVISDLPQKPRYVSVEADSTAQQPAPELDRLRRAGYGRFKLVQQNVIPGKAICTTSVAGKVIRHVFPVHASGPFGEEAQQPWLTHDAAAKEYERIRRKHERLREHAGESPAILAHPGWHDIHASLEDDQDHPAFLATVVITCKNRLAHLKQTLPGHMRQANVEVIVVDYGCSEGTAAWVREHHPSARVIVVDDDPVFSLSRARNIGAMHATADYIVFTDADIHIDFPIGDWISRNGIAGEFYTIDPANDSSLCGTVIVNRYDFWRIDGYDEAFRGWGWEDTELYMRLIALGLSNCLVSPRGISAIPHGDDLRQFAMADGGAGSKERAMWVGSLYTRIKKDLFDRDGQVLALEERLELMARIRRLVEDFYQSGEVTKELALDAGVQKKLSYTPRKRLHYQIERYNLL